MPVDDIDFLAILKTLNDYDVDFIVVGGICAVLLGAPIATFDVDIVHCREKENLDRLEQALAALRAHYREHADKDFRPNAEALATAGHHLLMTAHGPLDVLGAIGKGEDYASPLPHAQQIIPGPETKVRILDLKTLIRVKETTARDKDQAVLATLRGLAAEKQR